MRLFLVMCLLFITPCFAAHDVYPFQSAETEHRFENLSKQLRCLVCQNQNIAESNAPLAKDLRDQIYLKMQMGQSDPEIVAYLVERFGDYILYRPPVNVATIGLWFSPLIVLIAGLSYLLLYLRNKQRE